MTKETAFHPRLAEQVDLQVPPSGAYRVRTGDLRLAKPLRGRALAQTDPDYRQYP